MCEFESELKTALADLIKEAKPFDIKVVRDRIRSLVPAGGKRVEVLYKPVKYETLAWWERNGPEGWVLGTKIVPGQSEKLWEFWPPATDQKTSDIAPIEPIERFPSTEDQDWQAEQLRGLQIPARLMKPEGEDKLLPAVVESFKITRGDKSFKDIRTTLPESAVADIKELAARLSETEEKQVFPADIVRSILLPGLVYIALRFPKK